MFLDFQITSKSLIEASLKFLRRVYSSTGFSKSDTKVDLSLAIDIILSNKISTTITMTSPSLIFSDRVRMREIRLQTVTIQRVIRHSISIGNEIYMLTFGILELG